MAGLRIKLESDGAGGVRPATVCADGEVLGELCGCEACPICCGTGNQCEHWARLDAVLLADPAEEVQDVADIPYFNRVNGWTKFGTAFDVVVTASGTESFDNGLGYVETATITLAERRMRFRLGPFGATNAELIALFGAPTAEGGMWKSWDTNGGANVRTFVADASPLGYAVSATCSQWWYDEGLWNGTHSYAETGETTIEKTAVDGIAADLDIPASPLNALLALFPPLRQQDFVSVSEPTPISNILCDGHLWSHYWDAINANRTTSPFSANLADPTHGETFRPPWLDSDPDVAAAAQETLKRIGASFSAAAGGGSYSVVLTVDHGEVSSASWTEEDEFIGGGGFSRDVSISFALERITEAQCPAYDSLPANACDPPDWIYRVGRECNNPSRVVIYDPTTRPTPVEDWPTFLHTGDDAIERRYLATDEPSPLAAETVTWTEDPCPTPTPTRCIAEICNTLDIGPDRPATVVYTVDPVLGAGNGRVRLTVVFPNPACPEDRDCTEWIEYRPTDEETEDPATPAALHIAGTPCLVPTRSGRCVGCDEPIPVPTLMAGPMAMGIDPMAAQMRHFGGGCCG
jgi:hypothetical protein